MGKMYHMMDSKTWSVSLILLHHYCGSFVMAFKMENVLWCFPLKSFETMIHKIRLWQYCHFRIQNPRKLETKQIYSASCAHVRIQADKLLISLILFFHMPCNTHQLVHKKRRCEHNGDQKGDKTSYLINMTIYTSKLREQEAEARAEVCWHMQNMSYFHWHAFRAN